MNVYKLAALASFALTLAGCCCGNMKPKGSSTDPTAGGTRRAAAADMKIEAAVLLKDYKANEVRADGLYKGKTVDVTGKVGDIKKDILDKIYVTLGTGAQFEMPTVQAYFDDAHTAQASALSKGATITVRGVVGGLMGNVQLKDCEFVP